MADQYQLKPVRRCYELRDDGIDLFWLDTKGGRQTIRPWPELARLDQAGQLAAIRRIGYRPPTEYDELDRLAAEAERKAQAAKEVEDDAHH